MKVKKEFEKIWGVIFGGLKISFLGLAVLVILFIIVKGVCPLLLPLVSLDLGFGSRYRNQFSVAH